MDTPAAAKAITVDAADADAAAARHDADARTPNPARDAAQPPEPPARVPASWPARPFSRSVKVGRLDWHVQLAGQGPLILMLHGTGASAHSWAGLLPGLAPHATVLAVDLPGHGFTLGAAAAQLTLPQMAQDLEALLAAMHLPAPTLVVGHSAGAALALRFALNAAQPPRAIIGFNPSLVPPPALYGQVLGPLLTPLFTSAPVASIVSALSARTGFIGRLLDSTRSALTDPQRAHYAALFSMPAHVRGAMGFMAVADLPALMHSGSKLNLPCTFVYGQQDAWIPEKSSRAAIASAFPGSTALSWPGGHLMHEADPAKAAALVLEVLRGVTPPPATAAAAPIRE
jgi:magnesium chelatase accessory protein